MKAEIIKQGYGFAYTRFPFQYVDEFRRYERGTGKERQGKYKSFVNRFIDRGIEKRKSQ